MLYAIITTDVENSLPLRKQHRAAHLERLQALLDAGRLIIAGPHPSVDAEDPGDAGFSGSLIVAEFESLPAAQEWAAQDPYMLNKITASLEIKPFMQALP